MLAKTYTCEVVGDDGLIVGSRVCRIMLWEDAKVAYDILLSTCKIDTAVVNFRRVK